MKKYLFILSTVLLSSYAVAEDSWVKEIKQLKQVKAINICEKERNQDTVTAGECYKNEFKKSDKKLNTLYQSYYKSLSSKDQNTLKKAQRGWLQYKENDCKLISNAYEGGSWQGIVNTQCQIDKINQRNIELLKLKNCGMESSSELCD